VTGVGSPDTGAAERSCPPSFFFAYAFAWAGGAIAYTPILTLLVPIRFTELAGRGDVHWLGLSATLGAVAASAGNIVWGALSDRRGRRLHWALAGLVGYVAATLLMTRADTPARLVAVIALWQVVLNLLLGPLSAYAAETVPDRQKGVLGGFLSFAPGAAALSVALVSFAGHGWSDRVALVASLVVAASLPLLVARRRARVFPDLKQPPAGDAAGQRATLVRLWLARLAVQIAEGVLFIFLYYYLRHLAAGSLSVTTYALANAAAQLGALPLALVIGRHADRTGRRRLPLLGLILLMAAGLVGMVLARGFAQGMAAYALFLFGSNSFLALHSAYVMQELRDPRRIGRDLGIFNLTNTLPSLLVPLLAAWVITTVGYSGLMTGLALFMLVPAALIFRLRLA
jgi:MFS family permease